LESETKDVGIRKVSEQLQETMVIIYLAALVPQELVEMIPGFQFSFQKYFFCVYVLQASLHPKFLYSSFIWVSGTLFFPLHEQAAKQLTTATWFGTQSLNVSILVIQAKHNATGTWLLCAPKILAVEAMYLDRHPLTTNIH
jgi:ABC-type anion transport system duplicated permease subunit